MIPVVLGGQDSIWNAQLACRSCNVSKGPMTDKEIQAAHAAHLPRAQVADSSNQAGTPSDKPTPLVAAEALRAREGG